MQKTGKSARKRKHKLTESFDKAKVIYKDMGKPNYIPNYEVRKADAILYKSQAKRVDPNVKGAMLID